MRILVTGAGGFIGSALCRALVEMGHEVLAESRRAAQVAPAARLVVAGAIGPGTDWSAAVKDVEAIVHLAGRTHLPAKASAEAIEELRAVNVAGTERLARMAAAAGVRRFVFVSSAKVNGEQTVDHPFTEQDLPCPQDAYAISKWEAEQALHQVAADTGLEVVVVRPPLVYGPDVGGNFLNLMGAVARGVPMPLGCVDNARSLIYLGNLVDALATCLHHPQAAGETFLVSDGTDVSTPELVRKLAHAMGRRASLWPIPRAWIRLAARLAGRPGTADRLLSSLCIDSTKIRRMLGWHPPFAIGSGLEETAKWFEQHRTSG